MSTPLHMTFAQLCRETRTMLDVTQQELAEAVGVSRPYVASIENGRANPSLEVVERIGSALGLELQLVGRHLSSSTVLRSTIWSMHDARVTPIDG